MGKLIINIILIVLLFLIVKPYAIELINQLKQSLDILNSLQNELTQITFGL